MILLQAHLADTVSESPCLMHLTTLEVGAVVLSPCLTDEETEAQGG